MNNKRFMLDPEINDIRSLILTFLKYKISDTPYSDHNDESKMCLLPIDDEHLDELLEFIIENCNELKDIKKLNEDMVNNEILNSNLEYNLNLNQSENFILDCINGSYNLNNDYDDQVFLDFMIIYSDWCILFNSSKSFNKDEFGFNLKLGHVFKIPLNIFKIWCKEYKTIKNPIIQIINYGGEIE